MNRAPSRFLAVLRDQRGVAMVEFAILLPLLLVILLGSVEVAQLVEAHRRMTHAASTVADLVSRQRTVDSAALDDIFLAGELVMAPLPSDALGVRVSSFVADSGGRVTRAWVKEGRTYAGDAPASLPPGYELPRNQGVIVADVSYRYRPLLRWALTGDIAMQKRLLLRPRISDTVTLLGS